MRKGLLISCICLLAAHLDAALRFADRVRVKVFGWGLQNDSDEDTALPMNPNSGYPYTTYYFRTHFQYTNTLSGVTLPFTNCVDDGAVFYLNGAELYRLGMPPAHGSPCGQRVWRKNVGGANGKKSVFGLPAGQVFLARDVMCFLLANDLTYVLG